MGALLTSLLQGQDAFGCPKFKLSTSLGVRGFKAGLSRKKTRSVFSAIHKQKTSLVLLFTLTQKYSDCYFVKNYGLTENDTKIKRKALQKRLGYGIIISKGREIWKISENN